MRDWKSGRVCVRVCDGVACGLRETDYDCKGGAEAEDLVAGIRPKHKFTTPSSVELALCRLQIVEDEVV